MVDLNLMRRVRLRVLVKRDTELPPARALLRAVLPNLRQDQARGARRRTPVGDFGKSPNFLQQLQHSNFRGHGPVFKGVSAVHVPAARLPCIGVGWLRPEMRLEMRLGRLRGFCLAHVSK